MRSLRASLLAGATAAATLAVYAAPAVAANPVCADPVPRELCGGRVFAEPLQSATGLTFAGLVAGLEQLAADHPDWVTFEAFGEGSADGNPLYAVEVTSPDSTIPLEDRKIVLANQSIHGNEPGGREGAARYVEDLVTGRDPERTALLDRVRLVQTFVNPDGWTAGDHDHAQTGGGIGLWARQNGDGAVTGAGDFGLGTDLNRQAPWRGLSFTRDEPVSEPESIAFEQFVRDLAAEGDIQASVDIHGEVTDAVAWVMLSSGQFDLDDAMNQRYHGEDLDRDLQAALESSQATSVMETIEGDIPATVLTASSEFGSISRESTASGTGFQGDWIAQPEGGDSASLSTIELYNFIGSPGVNSLTARKEVMQLYRDAVTGILASLIESAAVEHDTRLAAGDVAYVDDAPRVADPVRQGVMVSSADFWRDLAPLSDGAVTPIGAEDLVAGAAQAVDSVVVTTAGLLSRPGAVDELRAWVEAGGNLVLTDAALRLLPDLVDGITAGDLSTQVDDGGKVSYDRRHPLAEGIREISWLNTETATMGLEVTGGGSVPTWRVATGAWEAAGGTTAGVSGSGQTSVGEVAVGEGTIRTIGVLLPTPSNQGRILYGINGYGVIDTGYTVLANALDGELVHTTGPAIEGAPPVGEVTIADVAPVAPPAPTSRALPAALVLLGGLALTLRAARRPDGA